MMRLVPWALFFAMGLAGLVTGVGAGQGVLVGTGLVMMGWSGGATTTTAYRDRAERTRRARVARRYGRLG